MTEPTLEQSDVYRRALGYLARREYARKELSTKLKSKHYPQDEIVAVLDALAEKNYLNDSRAAVTWVSHYANRGYGPRYIEKQLGLKGVAQDEIALAIESAGADWDTLLEKTWRKKFKSAFNVSFEMQIKQKNFLMMRGYFSDSINRFFNELKGCEREI